MNRLSEPCARSIIDYFKPSFNFAINSEEASKLFVILKIEEDRFIQETSLRDNMLEHRVYDQSVHIYLNPSDKAERAGVIDYFTVELSGQACREFELRGGSWLELLEFMVKTDSRLLQLHLAKDAMNGMLPFEELKRKVEREEFISSFRRSRAGGSVAKSESSGSTALRNEERYYYGLDYSDLRQAEYNDSVNIVSKVGWSATFGRRESCQLQIYDKLVERATQANYKAPFKAWLRIEMRWGSDKADIVKPMLYDALRNDRLDELTSSLLFQLLDFKEIPPNVDRSNYNKLPTWQPWLDFLGPDSEKIKISPLEGYQPSVQRSIDWISYGVARTLLKLYLIDEGRTMAEVINRGIADKILQGKLDNRLLSEVNNYLRMVDPERKPLQHEKTLARIHSIYKDYLGVSLPQLISISIDRKKYPPRHHDFESDQEE